MDLTGWTIWSQTVLLVAARVAGIFFVAPVLGGASVPLRLRYFMTMVVAVAVTARLSVPAAPIGLSQLLGGIGCELLVGLTIGYVARLVFVGVEIAAAQAAQQMGLAMAELSGRSPSDGRGVVGRMYWMVATVVFLGIGGHRMVIAAVLRTFSAAAGAGLVVDQGQGQKVLATVTGVLSVGFVLGLKIAAPVLVAMLLTTVALGLLQKAMPQCNVLSIGLPVRSLVGLVVLSAFLWVMVPLLEGAVSFMSGELSALFAVGGEVVFGSG